MNKRGQVFLIAAIIFSIAIYSVAIEYNTIKTYPALEDYKELSENYQTEYPKVINFAIYNGTDPTEAASNFTQAFLGQTEQTDPNFGVLYLFKDPEGNVHIVNTLNNKMLNIQLTNIEAEELNLMIPGRVGSEGQICIEGIGTGCSGAEVDLENYGSGYDNVEDLESVETLFITIPGLVPETELLIANFTSMTLIQSEESVVSRLGTLERHVSVTITQY